jgi:putative sterol carrier protein
MKVAYQDFVDIIGNRLNPMRAIATGKLRPRGNPLVLSKMGRIFPRD